MSRVHTPLTPDLTDYIRQVALREPEALRRQRESTDAHPRASMQTAPEQGQLLHLLARVAGARKALEVGVFLGYSSTWVALALPEGGKIVACDQSQEYTAEARRLWREAGVEDKIELRLGPEVDPSTAWAGADLIATSPSMVSGLVVAMTTWSSLSFTAPLIGYLM